MYFILKYGWNGILLIFLFGVGIEVELLLRVSLNLILAVQGTFDHNLEKC
jgi:hypothetical protein